MHDFLNQRAEINGTTVAYRLEGDGPALVFVHAGIADGRSFEAQLEPFAKKFRVLIYDIRGFGQTHCPNAPFSFHEDLKALLDHVGIEQASLVAMSMGGKITINFALTYPERVEKLVLVAPAVDGQPIDDPWANSLFEQAVNAYESDDRRQAAEIEMRTWLVGPGRELDAVSPALREQITEMVLNSYVLEEEAEDAEPIPFEPPAIERIEEISVPTLLLIGQNDVGAMIQIVDMLEKRLPNARKITLANTAHMPNMEVPDIFNQHVMDFLTEA